MILKQYDLIVLGAGTAGMGVVYPAAAKGWKTALVEPAYLGGTCVNVGCIPSKILISSANAVHHVKAAAALGVKATLQEVDWTAMVARKEGIIGRMRDGSMRSIRRQENVTLYQGAATFVDAHTVSVNGDLLQGERIVIATGARSAVPPVPGLNEINFLTSTTVMSMEQLPAHMLILGGGIIALEFAQMLIRLGVAVTIVERADRLAANLDPAISEQVRVVLEGEGVVVFTGADVQNVTQQDHTIRIHLQHQGVDQVVTGDQLLVATGRTPNTDALGLDSTGIQIDARGYIQVDAYFRTAVDGVWAIGDVTGGMMFTHKAWHDSVLLAGQLLEGKMVSSRGRLIPFAVFTDPEVAGAGIGHSDLEKVGHEVSILKAAYGSSARAKAIGRETGFITLYTHPEDGKVLGVQMVGPGAGETIHEVLAVMRLGGTVHDLADMMHIHPTLAEMINITALSG
jgi:pyruvate/2-oxoglutarate dehydrogenase complex dihydrolipoamide dehydrogenase (E3) component